MHNSDSSSTGQLRSRNFMVHTFTLDTGPRPCKLTNCHHTGSINISGARPTVTQPQPWRGLLGSEPTFMRVPLAFQDREASPAGGFVAQLLVACTFLRGMHQQSWTAVGTPHKSVCSKDIFLGPFLTLEWPKILVICISCTVALSL